VPWAETGIPPVYDWLARQPGHDAVVELPIGLAANDAADMVLSARHWRPLVNGYSGFAPTSSFFRVALAAFPDESTLRLLHDVGVRWVVVHSSDLPPRSPTACDGGLGPLAAHAVIAHREADSCVIEVRSAPEAPPSPPDRPVSLTGITLTSSDGKRPRLADDGRIEPHWTRVVDHTQEDWLQLDFPEPHAISRLVIDLGRHFGEYLRRWRLETSDDGLAWKPIAGDDNAMPPLTEMRADPSRLRTELRIGSPVATRHVRIVRPKSEAQNPLDLWTSWRIWGINALHAYERAS
jgi:hypothetical protein